MITARQVFIAIAAIAGTLWLTNWLAAACR
jgi:hypothetical protein